MKRIIAVSMTILILGIITACQPKEAGSGCGEARSSKLEFQKFEDHENGVVCYYPTSSRSDRSGYFSCIKK